MLQQHNPMPAADAPEAAPATEYERVCWQLGGFDDRLSPEWIDGYLTGVLAGPRAIALEQWLPAMLGDTFERTFADPGDARRAQRALSSRWRELAQQLDAEQLVDDPDTVVLEPWIVAYEDADRERFVADGHGNRQQACDELRSGVAWSRGFVQATEDFKDDWVAPDDATDDAARFHRAFDAIRALQAPAAADGGAADERDRQIDDACLAAQQLRLYWVDHAPRPATRRVEAQPGRNDPCPCGSGLKFKKCHGATR